MQDRAETAGPCKVEQIKPAHVHMANQASTWQTTTTASLCKDRTRSSRAATFMGFRELEEEEKRHGILEEGIPQQLKAFIAVVLLAGLGSQGLQHIYYVGQPAPAA